MNPADALALAQALAPKRTAWKPPQAPTPKQAEFLALDCLEALYGGAAGGGKSSALLMAALQHVHVPGYAALILRRTYADLSLPGAIMDRAHDWLQGTGAAWNGTEKRWTFPSGAILQFGYCETAKDVYRYQGAEFHFIAIDELTQWPEQPYRYLFSRLRRAEGSAVPPRMRAASNPGGIGHEWVKRRFLDGTARFVPAALVDNPHVDAVAYRQALDMLDANTRKQLLEGVWTRDAGGLVYQYAEARNVAARPEHGAWTYLIGIDYGYTDATAFCVLGWREQDPTVYVVECYKLPNQTPSDAAEEAHRLSRKYQPVKMVGDVGGLGKGYAEEARRRFSLPIEPADKVNKRGYISLINGDLERGRIKVDPSRCAELVAEWQELPWTDDHAKEADGFDNHCADACLYAWRAASAYHEAPPAPKPTAEEARQAMEAAMWERAEEEERARQEGEWWSA